MPFVNRPVFVDDHAHFLQAIERGQNPKSLYSNEHGGLGWTKGETPTEANGPVYFYMVGIFTRVFGTEEWKTHLLIFTISFFGLLSFFDLARRYTAYPLWASLLWLTTPHVWLTANSLLLDSLLAPLTLMGLAMFIKGWDNNSFARLVSGSLLLGLVPLVKYTGLLGLAAAGLWILFEKKEILNLKWFSFLLPLAIIAGWLIFTRTAYDQSHFTAVFESSVTRPSLFSAYTLFAFLSGTTPFLLFPLVFFIFARQTGLLNKAIGIGLFTALLLIGIYLFSHNFWIGAQLGFWAGTGAVWIYSLLGEQKPSFPSRFFLAWTFLGLFGLLFARGWLCARYFVIVSPPLIFLNIWLLEKSSGRFLASFKFRFATLLILGLFSSLLAVADFKGASADKTLAIELNQKKFALQAYYPSATLSGLSFYLDPNKYKPIKPNEILSNGDFVILPGITLPQQFYPRIPKPMLVERWEFSSAIPFRTLGSYSGFYGSIWGPLPFSISLKPLDIYVGYQCGGLMFSKPYFSRDSCEMRQFVIPECLYRESMTERKNIFMNLRNWIPAFVHLRVRTVNYFKLLVRYAGMTTFATVPSIMG